MNQLELKERPIHCSDKKKQCFYIKDDNVWAEDKLNVKINKSIDSISKKQIRKIKEWWVAHPNWNDSDKGQESYMMMVAEVMGNPAYSKMKTYDTVKKDLGKSVDIGKLIEKDVKKN